MEGRNDAQAALARIKAKRAVPERFAGRVVLVTGGTSGIGEATARRFHAEGALVAFSGRNEARGRALAAELEAQRAGSCLFVACDHATREGCEECVQRVVARFGGLDVLFNNAGVVVSGTLADTPAAQFRELLASNVTSVFDMCQCALPHLRASRHGGVVVNNASDWALVAAAGAAAYCTTKAAVVMLTKCLALDEARCGVRACAVCPGDTFVERWVARARAEGDYPPACSDEQVRECLRLNGELPVGRVGEVEEVAALVCFLASDDASYMTGCAVPVDGGNSAK